MALGAGYGIQVQSRACVSPVDGPRLPGGSGSFRRRADGPIDRCMWFDLALVVLVGALAFGGFRRGGVEAGIRLAGLPLAYGAAVAAALFGGGAAASTLGVAGWIGTVACGTLAFVAVHAVVGMAALHARRQIDWISQPSRIAGACFGAARALVFAIPLLWLANLTEGARSSGVRPDLPDLSAAVLRSASEPVFEAGSELLLTGSEPSDRVAARFVAKPGIALAAAQDVLQDPRLRMLQSDPGFWSDVERGAVSHAMRRPTFRELARDASFRRKLGAFGLISDDAIRDPNAFELEMAQVFSQVAPRVAAIRTDPAFQKLMNDPELRRRLQQGEAMALLGHPGFRALIARSGEDPR